MNSCRIEARHIVFSYDEAPVLRDISLNVEAGELFAVVGPSGSGKTSLLRVLAGLEPPSSGEVMINGRLVNDIPAPERSVGMVFQDFALWPHMTVHENIVFGAADSCRSAVADARADELLVMLGIATTRNAHPLQLSGGQQQRVALARALMREPRLLLLDDPFSNIEHELRVQMRRDLHALQRKLALTAVFVTHDLEDAFSIADRVAVIGRGSILQIGTPTAVYDFPNSIDVARFVGIENFIPGTISQIDRQHIEFHSDDLGAIRWSLREPPPAGPSVLSIRPHALRLCPIDSFRDGRCAWFEGHVIASEFLGESVRYHVAVGTTTIRIKQPHILGAPLTPTGTPVLAGFDPTHARVFPASSNYAHGNGD